MSGMANIKINHAFKEHTLAMIAGTYATAESHIRLVDTSGSINEWLYFNWDAASF